MIDYGARELEIGIQLRPRPGRQYRDLDSSAKWCSTPPRRASE